MLHGASLDWPLMHTSKALSVDVELVQLRCNCLIVALFFFVSSKTEGVMLNLKKDQLHQHLQIVATKHLTHTDLYLLQDLKPRLVFHHGCLC